MNDKFRLGVLLPLFALTACGLFGLRADVMGKTWALKELNGHKVIENSHLTLSFKEQGASTGQTGCNSLRTMATLDEKTITLERIASTRMGCKDGEEMKNQEAEYLAALAKASTWSLRWGTLTLNGEDGKPLLRFSKDNVQPQKGRGPLQR